jgi:hypothetical protein
MNPGVQIPVWISVIVAVMIAAKFKKLINSFRNSGTTSSRTSKTPEQLRIKPDRIFRRLLNRGVIKEAGSGRYYLNEGNLDEFNQVRRIRAMIIFGVLILLILLSLFVLKY